MLFCFCICNASQDTALLCRRRDTNRAVSVCSVNIYILYFIFCRRGRFHPAPLLRCDGQAPSNCLLFAGVCLCSASRQPAPTTYPLRPTTYIQSPEILTSFLISHFSFFIPDFQYSCLTGEVVQHTDPGIREKFCRGLQCKFPLAIFDLTEDQAVFSNFIL